MALFDKLAAAALGAFASELAQTREVLKQGIDTFREANGMPLLYSVEPRVDDEPAADPRAPKPIVQPGDMLSWDLLVELAKEQGVRYSGLVELEQVARSRGWVDEEGKFLLLPQSYAGQELGEMGILAGRRG